MATRASIEQAKGIIMGALKVDAETAFQVLARRSQASHQRLIDVARGIVENTPRPSSASGLVRPTRRTK
jgi:AmiR/NasT family two-component response regulator